jgi:hypothetical protein
LLPSDLPSPQGPLLFRLASLQPLLPVSALQLAQLAALLAVQPALLGLLPQRLQPLRIGLDRLARILARGLLPELAQLAALGAIEMSAPR